MTKIWLLIANTQENENNNELVVDSSGTQSSEPDVIPLDPYKEEVGALLRQFSVAKADLINEDNPKEQIPT